MTTDPIQNPDPLSVSVPTSATTNLDNETPAAAPVQLPSNQLSEPKTKDAEDVTTRRYIAYALLVLLALIVLAAFIDLFVINSSTVSGNDATSNMILADQSADSARLTSMMQVVFGPVIALVSSVVGFYFGARTAKESGTG